MKIENSYKAILDKSVEVFARVNGITVAEVYNSSRVLPQVEARSQIWAYMRERTDSTLMGLAREFGKHHATVVHQNKQHKKYMGRVLKKSNAALIRVNEKYAANYETGKTILDEYFGVVQDNTLRFRVVMMVDDYPKWNVSKIIEAEEIV